MFRNLTPTIRTHDRNGPVTQFDYDGLNRLVEEWSKSEATTIHTVEYTFDAESQLTAVADDDSAYAMAD